MTLKVSISFMEAGHWPRKVIDQYGYRYTELKQNEMIEKRKAIFQCTKHS